MLMEAEYDIVLTPLSPSGLFLFLKKVFVVMALLAASIAFADEPPPGQGKGPGQNFDKFKSEVITRINASFARNQEELTCVRQVLSDLF